MVRSRVFFNFLYVLQQYDPFTFVAFAFTYMCAFVRYRRRDSIHERLPIAGDSSAGGTPAALAARESALPESADDGDYAGDYDSVDGEDRCMAMKNGDNQAEICGADEVAALRELVQQQKEDLETAASIGQRLLDSNDDLSTKLEVGNYFHRCVYNCSSTVF